MFHRRLKRLCYAKICVQRRTKNFVLYKDTSRYENGLAFSCEAIVWHHFTSTSYTTSSWPHARHDVFSIKNHSIRPQLAFLEWCLSLARERERERESEWERDGKSNWELERSMFALQKKFNVATVLDNYNTYQMDKENWNNSQVNYLFGNYFVKDHMHDAWGSSIKYVIKLIIL